MKKIENGKVLLAADGRRFVCCEYAFWGDYCGSTVERANAEWLQEKYKDHLESLCERAYGDPEYAYKENEYDEPDSSTWILEEYMAYYSFQMWILETEEDRENESDEYLEKRELQEIIDALEDYSVIDDEALSGLEDRLREEYLASEIPSACRLLGRTLSDGTDGTDGETVEQWEAWYDSLSDGESEQFERDMLERFPRYHESSGEDVAVYETGCTVSIRHFDRLFRETFYAYVVEKGLIEEANNV